MEMKKVQFPWLHTKEKVNTLPLSLEKLDNHDLPHILKQLSAKRYLYHWQTWKEKHTNHLGYIIKENLKITQAS